MENFVNYLESIGARYCVDTEGGVDKVYIFAKKDYDRYVPQIRVSNFDSEMLYVRDNGWCDYWNIDDLKKKIEKDYL